MVFKASRGHAPIVARNILASIRGDKTTVYVGKPEVIMVTLGPANGRAYMPFLWGFVLGGWLTSKIKSGSLFVNKVRGELGY